MSGSKDLAALSVDSWQSLDIFLTCADCWALRRARVRRQDRDVGVMAGLYYGSQLLSQGEPTAGHGKLPRDYDINFIHQPDIRMCCPRDPAIPHHFFPPLRHFSRSEPVTPQSASRQLDHGLQSVPSSRRVGWNNAVVEGCCLLPGLSGQLQRLQWGRLG